MTRRVSTIRCGLRALMLLCLVGSGASVAPGSIALADAAAASPAPFGINSFTTAISDESGEPFTEAGGHPFSASTILAFNPTIDEAGDLTIAGGDAKMVLAELPPGFIGNPQSTVSCSLEVFEASRSGNAAPGCPEASIVGYLALRFSGAIGTNGEQEILANPAGGEISPLYLLSTNPGQVAVLGFVRQIIPFKLEAKVRTDGDYGITLGTLSTPKEKEFSVLSAAVTVCGYGVTVSGGSSLNLTAACKKPTLGVEPFLTDSTRCAVSPGLPFAPVTTLRANTYQDAADIASMTSYVWAPSAPPVNGGEPTGRANPVSSSYLTGCDMLTANWTSNPSYEPSLELRPESRTADSPTGLSVDLHVPQPGLADSEQLGTTHLDDATVSLPEGLAINPSAAQGLQGCTEAEIGVRQSFPIRFNLDHGTCPDASQIGTVEVETPLLDHPLIGSVYLAAQDKNPFHSTYAIYVDIDDPTTGVIVKLAGEVVPNLVTGQLTTTFTENPQLPFTHFKLEFFGGSRASLVNPAICGEYTTRARLTPWSAEDPAAPSAAETATSSSTFKVEGGPNGGACVPTPQSRPFAPALSAGTEGTAAGARSPFVLKLTRNDGEQEFASLDTTLPPGLTARLAGIPYCRDADIAAAAQRTGAAERANPSCPAASKIGTVTTGAGAGPDPYYVTGDAYLAGPYRGAPLSVAFITPAVAGPFDLGNVVVRAGLYVNPETAQVTVKTDPIPRILEGVPLRIRSIVARIDRPDFTLNPTSCEPMSVGTSVAGSSGATATPSSRFQVGGCGDLPFKPDLKLRLKGATGRTGHPALRAVVTAKPGEANIGRAQVNLPHGEFLDQGNLNKTCTRPVLLAGSCPKSSIYGRARAWTPLLEKPLEGNVYLVGGYGYKLPALVADLNGQIRITLVGKVDSGKNHGIRNTFEVVPDAPVSRFVLSMKGGRRYGLLENSEDLCKAPKARRRAIVRFTGQNNKVRQWKPVVANQCGKHRKKTKRHKAHGGRKARQGSAHGRTR